MFKPKVAAVALSALIFVSAPVIDLAVVTAAAAQAAPSEGVIAAQISQALANLKQSPAYQAATPEQKGVLLAQAAQAVVASALTSGASATTIAAALNDSVKAGVLTGAIAVQAAAQASAQVAQSGGPGSEQAVSLTGDVQSEPSVQASLSTYGTTIAVTSTNSTGQSVTALVPLSSILSPGSTTTTTTTTSTTTFNPCAGVVADYC